MVVWNSRRGSHHGQRSGIHCSELNDDNGEPVVDIPSRRVKKRRVVSQPLSDLATQIIKEAQGNCEYVFTGRFGDTPLNRKAMAAALRGTKVKRNGKTVTKTPGLCELLGIEPFTPHDLRCTAATIAGRWFSDAEIAPCLDHQPTKDANGEPLPTVTGRHYNLAQRKSMQDKRRVLYGWAAERRRIIGDPAEVKPAGDEMRLAA